MNSCIEIFMALVLALIVLAGVFLPETTATGPRIPLRYEVWNLHRLNNELFHAGRAFPRWKPDEKYGKGGN